MGGVPFRHAIFYALFFTAILSLSITIALFIPEIKPVEVLEPITEKNISAEQLIVLLETETEKTLDSKHPSAYSGLFTSFKEKGAKLQSWNLVTGDLNDLPENSDLIMLLDPAPLSDSELQKISHLIQAKKNILVAWSFQSANPIGLLNLLGVEAHQNANASFGYALPSYVHFSYPLVAKQKGNPKIFLAPQAANLSINPSDRWQSTPILRLINQEVGVPQHIIGLSLEDPTQNQRIALLSDNHYLQNRGLDYVYSNQLAEQLFNWLLHEDRKLSLDLEADPELTLRLSPKQSWFLNIGLSCLLPLFLVIMSMLIVQKRKWESNRSLASLSSL
jgi:hypothetical protein